MKIDIVKHNKIWLSVTLLIILLAGFALGFWRLKLGIDFQGGTILEYKIAGDKSEIENGIKDAARSKGEEVSKINKAGENYSIFLPPLNEDQRRDIEGAIESKYQEAERKSIETIGPSVGEDLRNKSLTSVAISCLAVVIFLAFTFREVPKPASSWEFGVAAILAMLYDVLVVLGVYALLGKFYGVEIDALFVTALLTVMGFSIHDSIVVFDRIRENLLKDDADDFKVIVNNSLVETLARSTNVTVSVLIVLFGLVVIGGESIRWFVFALFVGMFSGAYSSVFVASQVLVWWQDMKGKVKFRFALPGRSRKKK